MREVLSPLVAVLLTTACSIVVGHRPWLGNTRSSVVGPGLYLVKRCVPREPLLLLLALRSSLFLELKLGNLPPWPTARALANVGLTLFVPEQFCARLLEWPPGWSLGGSGIESEQCLVCEDVWSDVPQALQGRSCLFPKVRAGLGAACDRGPRWPTPSTPNFGLLDM